MRSVTIAEHFKSRAYLIAFCLLCAVLFVATSKDSASAGSISTSVAEAMESEVLVDSSMVIEGVSGVDLGLTYRDLFFLGRTEEGAPRDLYRAEVRIGSHDNVLSYRNLRNLTRTGSADEDRLTAAGNRHLAYLSRVEGSYDALTLIERSGEAESLTEDWPARARAQNAVTNFQESGTRVGYDRRRFAFAEAQSEVEIEVAEDGESLELTLGEDVVTIPLDDWDPDNFESEHVNFESREKGMPGTITWVVDTVRNLSFVGPEPIAWLEHRVFSVKDALQRGYYAVFGEPDTEAEVAEELGLADLSEEEVRRRAELAVTDPELGWPPQTLTPVVDRPARGEGEWVAVVDDPYVRAYANAPPAFYTTFLQVDPERPFTRVYVAIWDPRAVQLRVMTGTREPESATGSTGSGLIPRDEETLERVVAGFNGGFQSLHGEFGMMSEGRVYLPPKPWAATVAVHDDGRVSMGSWTDPPEGVRNYREAWAIRQIPDDMVEYRQNLTSVLEGDTINPWGRWYWGAAPRGDDEQAYIDRSGICLTEEGFMAYFWGKSMGADELGEAMRATRCERGLHLDMNQRHTAFEFYNVMPEAELPELESRPTNDFQFQIDVPRAQGFVARGRLLARSMTPMRFPRYIRQDPRDFFYLTLRPLLPGPDMTTGDTTVSFDSAGLPHAGWPPAFAMAELAHGQAETDGEEVTRILRMDLTRAVPAPLRTDADEARDENILAYLTSSARSLRGPVHLCVDKLTVGQRAVIRGEGDDAPEGSRVILAGPACGPEHGACVTVDSEGFVVVIEGASGSVARIAGDLASSAVGLTDDQRIVFAVGDELVRLSRFVHEGGSRGALAFYGNTKAASEVLFPNVEPRPYAHWSIMQDTRVRYFRDESHRPRFTSPDEN